MRKLIPLIILLAFSVPAFAQSQAIVISKTAQFREKPSKKAKIISTVKKGAKFDLESETHKNGWYYVSVLNENQKGWIYGNNIRIDRAETNYIAGWAFVTDSQTGKIYYNASKTTKIGITTYFWLKIFTDSPSEYFDYFIGDISEYQQKEFKEKFTKTGVSYFLEQHEAVCKMRYMKKSAIHVSWEDGSEDEFYLFHGYQAPALPVVPDTVNDVILDKVCK